MAALDQLHQALINADAAGDVDGARQLAAEIKRISVAPAPAPAYNAGQDTGPIEAGVIGAGRVFDKAAMGLKQGVLSAADKLGLGGGDELAAMKADEGQKDAAYKQLSDAHPVATFVGEAAPTLLMKNPLMMAATAAASYGTPEERAMNGMGAYVGGKVGQGIGSFFGRILGGPATMADVTKGAANTTGNQWGIPLTAAQASDSKPLKLIESVVGNSPFGGAVTKGRDAAYQGFNRAASNTFGEDATAITPELLGAAKTRIGTQIGDIAQRSTITLDPDLVAGIQKVQQRAQAELTPEEATIVGKQIQNIWNAVDPETGAIPGTLYKATQSKLGEIGKNRGGTVSSVVGDLRTELRDAMTRSVSPEDSSAWLKANGEYFNMKQVADATKATPGSLSPAALLTQVNAAQKNARFGGGNDLAGLAQFAKTTLPDSIPNSGTAQRLMVQKLIENPVSAIGAGGGLLYGANQAGFDAPEAGAAALLPFLIGRGMAGRPTSAATKAILQRVGGSGGAETIARALRQYGATQ